MTGAAGGSVVLQGDPGSGHALVEREHELAALSRVVADLRSGVPSTALLCGPGGVGRSALLRWTRAHAEAGGCQVLVGRCSRGQAAIPLGLVSQLDTLPCNGKQGIAGLGSALLDQAAPRPLLLVLDDVQWIDPASEHWLRSMITRSADRPLGLVFTATDPCARVWQEYRIRSLPAPMTVLRLRPLSESAVNAVLRSHAGKVTDSRVARAVADSSRGLPALVHAAVAAGVVDEPDPRGAEELARCCADADADRAAVLVTGLPGELADLVRVLALLPGNLDFELLCALAGVRTMSSGRARELVRDVELGTGTMPPLAHDGSAAERILAGMDAARREDLYARAASIARRGALPDQDVARLLLRSRPIGESWAVDTLCREAADVQARGDFAAAVVLLTRALKEPLDDARRGGLEIDLAIAGTPDSPVTGERLLRRVILREGGKGLSQARLYAADLLVARGDDAEVRSVLGAACARTDVPSAERAALSALYWTADNAPYEGPELGLPRPAELPRGTDEPVQAGVESWWHAVRGEDLPATRALALSALADDTLLVTPKVLVCRTLMLTDDADQALAGLGRAIALAAERGAGALSATAHLARSRLHARDGRFEEAAADLEAALTQMPRRCWHPMAMPAVVAMEAALALEQGQVSLAESLLDVAWEPAVRRGFGWAQVLLAQGLVDLYRGRPAEAVTHLRECGRRLLTRGWTNPALLPWRTLTAVGLRALGRQEEAALLVAEELKLARRWGATTAIGGAHLGAALVLTGAEAEQHCATAVRLLRGSTWRLRYGQALAEFADHKVSAGAIGNALDLLRESDRLATECGARRLTQRVRGTAGRISELLSPAERKVIELAACGLSNADIAAQLAITRRTVEGHLGGVYRKTGCTRRHQLRALLDLTVAQERDRDAAGA